MKTGQIVLYQHRGKHRFQADRYTAEAEVLRIGKRITIRNLEIGKIQIVSRDSLIEKGE